MGGQHLYFFKDRYKSVVMTDQLPTIGDDGNLAVDKSKQAFSRGVDKNICKFFGVTWMPEGRVVRVLIGCQPPVMATVERVIKLSDFIPLGEEPPNFKKMKLDKLAIKADAEGGEAGEEMRRRAKSVGLSPMDVEKAGSWMMLAKMIEQKMQDDVLEDDDLEDDDLDDEDE